MSNWQYYFIYNEGDLYWKIKSGTHINIGDVAGTTDNKGYKIVRLNGKAYKQHRIIFELFNGDIPDGFFIDHIDRNPSNNLITNLRLATPSQNLMNHSKKGFTWREKKSKWEVNIRINGKKVYIGLYDCMLEARASYLRAKRKYHGGF